MIRTLSDPVTFRFIGLHTIPDEFWDEYRALWELSLYQSPFQAPEYLRYLSKKTSRPVFVFQFFRGDALLGATVFKITNNTLFFLSQVKSDHNYFILHQKTTTSDWERFFEGLLDTIYQNKFCCEFNNLAGWAIYQKSFEDSYRASPLFTRSVDSAVCLMLVKSTPSELGKTLNKSRSNRYNRNRLIREHGVTFHADTGRDDLSAWVKAFCACHIERWSDTATPSAYLDPKKIEALEAFLLTWEADNLLVRFSIRKEQENIAFCIGLLQQDSLIHHSTTYSQAFSKYSVGSVLMLFIGEWMQSNNLNTLDFGYGNEAYKYRYTNEKGILKTLFAAPKSSILFRGKANIIAFFRERPFLIDKYRQHLRPLIKQFQRTIGLTKSVHG